MAETIEMVHAWVVPGWESPKGVFSHDNPDVYCADATNAVNAMGLASTRQRLPSLLRGVAFATV